VLGKQLVPPPLAHVTLNMDYSDIEPRLSRWRCDYRACEWTNK